MKRQTLKKLLVFLACIAMPALPVHAGQKIADNIELSGLVEVEAGYSGTDADDTDASDIVLATLELGIDAEIADWISAHVLFLYEEDETDGIEVDEAFASLTPGDSGLYLNAGRFAQNFGSFPSSMITDPVTLDLGETTQTSSVAIGWGNDSVDASFGVYRSDVQKTDEDHVNTWVGALNLNGEVDNMSIEAGVSYTNNIAGSDGLSGDFELWGPNGFETGDFVGGYSGYIVVGFDSVQLSGEYLAAAEAFTDGDRAGMKPAAYNVELAWDAPSPLAFAARVAGGDEFDVDSQYGAAVSYDLYEGVALAAEYLRNNNSDDSNEDIFTVQLAAEF